MSDELITERYAYSTNGLIEYRHDEQDKIRDLLLGHRIEKIADDHLRLDDGTVMRIDGNVGCACPSGNYELTDLNEVDNVITAVRFVEHPTDDYSDDEEGYYEIFVMAEDKYMRLMRVEGTDGNGYYGTGYQILVRPSSSPSSPNHE